MNNPLYIDISTLLTFTKCRKNFSTFFSQKNICVEEGFLSKDANLLYSINGRPITCFQKNTSNKVR